MRQDWQQRRDDVRQDWQQHRDEARDDWQDWFDDHYGRYGGWYGGHAPGYWGHWDYLWDNYPVAAATGLTWWGANSLGYQFGYSDYSNPYYTESMPVYYTEPVVTMPIVPAQEPAAQAASPCRRAFRPTPSPSSTRPGPPFSKAATTEALKLTDEAVALMPHDAVLHEFRSLVLFALKRYAESAAAIHAVLDVGPGWDWETMGSLYPNIDVYTNQLRALEAARDKDPKAADLRFLAGYHYLTLGHPDAALPRFGKRRSFSPRMPWPPPWSPRSRPVTPNRLSQPAAAAPKSVPAATSSATWTAAGSGTAKYP